MWGAGVPYGYVAAGGAAASGGSGTERLGCTAPGACGAGSNSTGTTYYATASPADFAAAAPLGVVSIPRPATGHTHTRTHTHTHTHTHKCQLSLASLRVRLIESSFGWGKGENVTSAGDR